MLPFSLCVLVVLCIGVVFVLVRALSCCSSLFVARGGTGEDPINPIKSNELLTQQPWRLICVLYIGEGFGAASGISGVGLQD